MFSKKLVVKFLLVVMLIVSFTHIKPLFSDTIVINEAYYKDPKLLTSEITKRGASTIVSEIYSDPNKWDFVLQNIATGIDVWLKAATLIHDSSSEGANDMLNLAVGEALEKNPINVFNIALPEFKLEFICGCPDVDDSRFGSYELAIKAIERRQKKISSVTDKNLRSTCNECIELLNIAKKDIARYYEQSPE